MPFALVSLIQSERLTCNEQDFVKTGRRPTKKPFQSCAPKAIIPLGRLDEPVCGSEVVGSNNSSNVGPNRRTTKRNDSTLAIARDWQ